MASIPEDKWPLIVGEYQSDTTMGAIGHIYNCSRFQIRKILLAAGVELRKDTAFKRIPDPTPEEIAERAAAVRRTNEEHIIRAYHIAQAERIARARERYWYAS